MAMGQHISALYFDYKPIGRYEHQSGCSAADSNQWEATEYIWDAFASKTSERTIRLSCPACGAAVFLTWEEDNEAEEATVKRKLTNAGAIGYGSKPQQVAGLWLHAGPSLWEGEENGPTAYYLTRTKDRPRARTDVLGVVGWKQGPRGGIKWAAGIGCGEIGGVKRAADVDFASRPAAVKWVVAELEAEHAAAPAVVCTEPLCTGNHPLGTTTNV